MQISLMFFASDGDGSVGGRYELLLQSCRYADTAGFTAVWLPERHFHRFGGLFPNPAIPAAAVAIATRRLRIRAGSVIIPLSDPIRVAEEWSVVDNLSDGRVDLGFGQGWNPNDFVLRPQNFEARLALLYQGIADVRALWSGRHLTRTNGVGQSTDITIYPKPVQPGFETWVTCTGSDQRFDEAGRMGANVLTALLFQDVIELKQKITIYRRARAQAGHAGCGHVTLMLHTFVGVDSAEVRNIVREPFMRYLSDSVDLWKQNYPLFDQLSPDDRKSVLEFACEKYLRTHSLCGSVEECKRRTGDLIAAGVDEIACLIDFGVARDDVLASLRHLDQLRLSLAEKSNQTRRNAHV
ncbi:MAG: LLM class flavin-dependent oxidoreductase [Rhizobiales bacterium]|nr:LLM class flavin-dependent oxidoreductase [Hyphomicrobiales bacterium]